MHMHSRGQPRGIVTMQGDVFLPSLLTHWAMWIPHHTPIWHGPCEAGLGEGNMACWASEGRTQGTELPCAEYEIQPANRVALLGRLAPMHCNDQWGEETARKQQV